jgi:hypothetical protein
MKAPSTCRSGRLNVERGWWQKPDPDGQKAVTNWKVRGRGDGLCWLALNRAPAAPINCACTLSDRLADSSATISTATARASASPSCTCIPARS